MADRS